MNRLITSLSSSSCLGLLLVCGCDSTPDAIMPAQVSLAATSVQDDSPIADAMRRADYAIQKIIDIPDDRRTFDNTVGAIDDMATRLGQDTDMVAFLAYVSPDADIRETGERAVASEGNGSPRPFSRRVTRTRTSTDSPVIVPASLAAPATLLPLFFSLLLPLGRRSVQLG